MAKRNREIEENENGMIQDFKLSEIKAVCEKQNGCEKCPFAVKQAMGGVCQFSPIGTTPAAWNIRAGDR